MAARPGGGRKTVGARVSDSAGRLGGLYVIVDPDACAGRGPVAVARLALEGGASVIQWRDKRRDKGDQLADASAIAAACHGFGALFIVNDHADLAIACGAGGVHLGQHDLPIETVRPIVGPEMVIGVSTNNVAEARAAQAASAGYVAVGAIFATSSKDATRPASLERLREVKAAVSIPVVAIGGINAGNIHEVAAAGADAAAVISAVCSAPDPRAAAHTLTSAFNG
jgi:thiamine-phosphate diphosphorylase